jgi:hypothetical protein
LCDAWQSCAPALRCVCLRMHTGSFRERDEGRRILVAGRRWRGIGWRNRFGKSGIQVRDASQSLATGFPSVPSGSPLYGEHGLSLPRCCASPGHFFYRLALAATASNKPFMISSRTRVVKRHPEDGW